MPEFFACQIVSIDAFDRGKEFHFQQVQETGAGARIKKFLEILGALLKRIAKIEKKACVPILKEDFVPPYFSNTAITCDQYHEFCYNDLVLV